MKHLLATSSCGRGAAHADSGGMRTSRAWMRERSRRGARLGYTQSSRPPDDHAAVHMATFHVKHPSARPFGVSSPGGWLPPGDRHFRLHAVLHRVLFTLGRRRVHDTDTASGVSGCSHRVGNGCPRPSPGRVTAGPSRPVRHSAGLLESGEPVTGSEPLLPSPTGVVVCRCVSRETWQRDSSVRVVHRLRVRAWALGVLLGYS